MLVKPLCFELSMRISHPGKKGGYGYNSSCTEAHSYHRSSQLSPLYPEAWHPNVQRHQLTSLASSTGTQNCTLRNGHWILFLQVETVVTQTSLGRNAAAQLAKLLSHSVANFISLQPILCVTNRRHQMVVLNFPIDWNPTHLKNYTHYLRGECYQTSGYWKINTQEAVGRKQCCF